MNEYCEVLFDELPGYDGNIGLITLNRPQVLNSLNHTMILALHAQLKRWAAIDTIKAVVIQSEGRAFCAGGDLRLTYQRRQANDPCASHFFRDEYALNQFIFHFPKPYIALLDGITMGGGVGISIHGSHRIVTENTIFAMPETGIGFYPDVGGTYFLPKLPGQFGIYLGLTGARINGDDCVALGIAQGKIAANSKKSFIAALANAALQQDAHASISQILTEYSLPIASSCMQHQAIIERCIAHHDMEAIVTSFQANSSTFCQEAYAMLCKKSPTSLKVTLRALRAGCHLDFDYCMQREYALSCYFLQQHDFAEGIRALIIDKDQHPNWQPRELTDVSAAMVDQYFQQ